MTTEKPFVMVERVKNAIIAFSYVPGATTRQRNVEVVRDVGRERVARTYPMSGRYGAYSADASAERFDVYHAAIDQVVAREYSVRGCAYVKNRPYSVGAVADAEVLAEIQTHPRHWRIFRRGAIGGAS